MQIKHLEEKLNSTEGVPLCLKQLKNQVITPIDFEVIKVEKIKKYGGSRSHYSRFYKSISSTIPIAE